jgi:pyrroloquinoline quinone biosynthesis protein B
MSRFGPILFVLCLVLACADERKEANPVNEPSVSKNTKGPAQAKIDGPRVRILGIAQDGGLPHAACRCAQCSAARRDPTRGSFVASVGIIAPKAGQTFLVDVTPDVIAQLNLLADVRTLGSGNVDRAPVDGAFLTHAHMGHYLGLAHLGFEAVNTKGMPLWCTEKMGAFLTKNAPWDRLVSQKNVALKPVRSGEAVALPDGISVTPISVPHRAEYTDTVGYYIAGSRSKILYIPDTSPWHVWSTPMLDALDGVDVALLDGTFYSGDELPGRDISKIGHPLIVDTMKRLESRVKSGKLAVYFVHLNHTNPALDPTSAARKAIEQRGFHVAHAGLELPL